MIDEINRCVFELQSKWLECIRSRKIGGFPTQVKWVWAAMNPISYSVTQELDGALIGRFALFLYPPDVLQMSEEDRIRVTTHINGDDAPSLSEWLPGRNGKTISTETFAETGKVLREILAKAARHFVALQSELSTLSEFLARFANLALKESKGEIALDGRRLGFLYRNILANRAIELAKAEVLQQPLGSFAASAKYALQSSVPIGLNDESLKREEAVHTLEICFDLLSSYFQDGSPMETVNRIYELFTVADVVRKTEILLTGRLGELVESKAWHDLINSQDDITLLAYTALQVETHQPGTIPQELLENLSHRVAPAQLTSESLPNLRGEAIEYIDDIEALLNLDTDLGKLIAFNRIRKMIESGKVNSQTIEETRRLIGKDIESFRTLIQGKPNPNEIEKR